MIIEISRVCVFDLNLPFEHQQQNKNEFNWHFSLLIKKSSLENGLETISSSEDNEFVTIAREWNFY